VEENTKTDIPLNFYIVHFRVSREKNRLHQGEISFTAFSLIQIDICIHNERTINACRINCSKKLANHQESCVELNASKLEFFIGWYAYRQNSV